MVCIYCGKKTQVTNSRPQKRLMQIWRRRNCLHCGAVFTTTEAVDLSSSLVIRHQNGTLEPFKRDVLLISIVQACGHRKTPIDDAGALTATIIAKLRQSYAQQATIDRSAIITTTLEVLLRFDIVAASQYGAYHTS